MTRESLRDHVFHLKAGTLAIWHWSESPCQLLHPSLSARAAHGLLNTSPNHPRCSLLPQQAKATRRACDSNRSVWTEEAPQSTPQLGRMGLAFTRLFARLFSKKEMRILMASPRISHSCCRQLCRQDQRPARRWQIPVAAVLPAGQFRSL